MKRRRQAAESQKKGVQAVRLRLADIYGGMISSRLKEDAALPVLAQSIARHGLLQPIVVQENEENGRYMLVCGARRLAACRLLGMTQIDAVQIPGRKSDAAACFLEDHFTRQTVPFLKEAALLQRAEVAEKCCLPEGEIRRRLAMLRMRSCGATCRWNRPNRCWMRRSQTAWKWRGSSLNEICRPSRRDGWFPNRKTARSMAKDAPCAGRRKRRSAFAMG